MQKRQLLGLMVAACTVLVLPYIQIEAHSWYTEKGLASWYGKAHAGRPTTSGKPFSPQEMTAAHRKLPLGTKVLVENLETGEKAEVKITDRGPYANPQRRIIDLSHAAAASISIAKRGVGPVRIVVTEPAPKLRDTQKNVRYAVQVGTFVENQEARRVLKQLQDRYPAAYIDPRSSPSGQYYRVRVGPFDTEQRAEKVAQALTRQGYCIFLDEVPT
jgi:peptidoglycan lytic transglycosylase